MATFIGDSSSERHTSITMSKSASSSSATTAASLANADMSLLEGLDGVEIHLFTSITKMPKIIKSQRDKLQARESNQQYLVFNRVTQDTQDKIDNARENGRIQKRTRMTHYMDTDLLIIKLMPLVAYEAVHIELAKEFLFKFQGWEYNQGRL
jgi:hypothetical protein